MRKGYAAGTPLENAYPTEADLLDWFYDRGLELQTDNEPEYILTWLKIMWALLNAVDWALPLGVYAPTSTTFNVRGGKYLFAGGVKTYTPGANIDPTDNDTTYVWMNYNNTVGSGIDGSGWPSTTHIKLAEVDVDEDGVITDIRDLRSQAFLQWLPATTSFILTATLTAGSTVQIYNANNPFKFRVLDAWSVAKSADGGTWKLTNGASDITNTVTVTGTNKTINRAGTIDDAYHEIAAAGSLSVVGDGANADVEVYILCMRVD
jgi:hypothetical protein